MSPGLTFCRRSVFGGLLVLLSGCGVVENMSETLEISVAGSEIRLDGIINARAEGAFLQALRDNPQARVVVFGDVQGALDDLAVVDMGYALRKRGLATHMDAQSQVFSGGVDLFLAGVSRTVAPGAVVGVHEWEDAYGSAQQYPKGSREHEPMRSYIEDMLGSDAFYWFSIRAARHDQIHLMTRAELRRYSVVTREK